MKSLIRMTMVLGLVLCVATALMAQPPGGGRGRGGQGGQGGRGGFGGGGFGGGSRSGLSLLSDEAVKKDLGITDDQVKKLEEFQAKSRTEMQAAFQGLRDLSAEERTAKFQELQKKSAEMSAAAEKEILLPKQIERLKQIGVQSRLGRGNLVDGLTSEPLAKDLGITDAQKEDLKKAQEEADAEMQAGIAKLREAARQKIMGKLTPDQQAKLKSLSGETITLTRGGGRGGPGGTGTRGGAGGRPGGAPLTRPPQGD